MSDHAQDPTDEELALLPAEATPPAVLEERVVAALRRDGLLPPRRGRQRLLLLAAAAACVAVGWIAREQAGRAVMRDAPGLYLLLLSQLPDSRDSDAQASLVEEYRQWADALRRDSRLVRGEKLGAETTELGAITPEARVNPSGFFLIRARSLDEATALARGCPHLRRGGSITIRNVDPT